MPVASSTAQSDTVASLAAATVRASRQAAVAPSTT